MVMLTSSQASFHGIVRISPWLIPNQINERILMLPFLLLYQHISHQIILRMDQCFLFPSLPFLALGECFHSWSLCLPILFNLLIQSSYPIFLLLCGGIYSFLLLVHCMICSCNMKIHLMRNPSFIMLS